MAKYFKVVYDSEGNLASGQRYNLGSIRQSSDNADVVECYIPGDFAFFGSKTQQQILAAYSAQLWVKRPNTDTEEDKIQYPASVSAVDGILSMQTTGTYAGMYKVIFHLDKYALLYRGTILGTLSVLLTTTGDDPDTEDVETNYVSEIDNCQAFEITVVASSYRDRSLTDDQIDTVALIYNDLAAKFNAKANTNILGNYASVALLATALVAATTPTDGLFFRGLLTDSTLGVTNSPYLAAYSSVDAKGYIIVANHVYTVASTGVATDYTLAFLARIAALETFKDSGAGAIYETIENVNAHINALSAHTKAQVGLGNADNTADTAKPISTPQQAALDLKINLSRIAATVVDGSADLPTSDAVDAAITNAIAGLVNSSPAALNTLYELAASLANDPEFATTMATALGLRYTKTEVDSLIAKMVTTDDSSYTDGLVIVQDGAVAKKHKQSAIPSAKLLTTDDTSSVDGNIVVSDSTSGKKIKKTSIPSSKLTTSDETTSTADTIIVQADTSGRKTKKSGYAIETLPVSTQQKAALDIIASKMKLVESINLINPAALTDGFITKAGVAGEGSYKKIRFYVMPGDSFSVWAGNAVISASTIRFTCCYDSNGLPLSASGSDANISTFIVPSGVASVVFSIALSLFTNYVQIVKGTTAPSSYVAYSAHYLPTADFINEFVPQNVDGYMRITAASLTTGNELALDNTNIDKNIVYAFHGNITTFSELTIGQGKTGDPYHTFIKIDATNITWTINGSDLVYAHSLTIADYIDIKIAVNSATQAVLTISSNGAVYTKTLGFYGFSVGYYYVSSNGSTLTDCVFSVSCKDLHAKTFVFGDSYVAIIESLAKWSHWLVADGYGDNILLNGLSGENGTQSLTALENILEIGMPKTLIWCLGMNDGTDPDLTTPNSTWLGVINSVIDICEANNITLILATIPTVPSINNEGKNYYIRNSGIRYIDFAKSVGASSSGVWFTGMLAVDAVHPTELGAKALYHRVLCDAPEVTIK